MVENIPDMSYYCYDMLGYFDDTILSKMKYNKNSIATVFILCRWNIKDTGLIINVKLGNCKLKSQI